MIVVLSKKIKRILLKKFGWFYYTTVQDNIWLISTFFVEIGFPYSATSLIPTKTADSFGCSPSPSELPDGMGMSKVYLNTIHPFCFCWGSWLRPAWGWLHWFFQKGSIMNHCSKLDLINHYAGRQLRLRRAMLGFSIEDFADQLGIKPKELSKYESEKKRYVQGSYGCLQRGWMILWTIPIWK